MQRSRYLLVRWYLHWFQIVEVIEIDKFSTYTLTFKTIHPFLQSGVDLGVLDEKIAAC